MELQDTMGPKTIKNLDSSKESIDDKTTIIGATIDVSVDQRHKELGRSCMDEEPGSKPLVVYTEPNILVTYYGDLPISLEKDNDHNKVSHADDFPHQFTLKQHGYSSTSRSKEERTLNKTNQTSDADRCTLPAMSSLLPSNKIPDSTRTEVPPIKTTLENPTSLLFQGLQEKVDQLDASEKTTINNSQKIPAAYGSDDNLWSGVKSHSEDISYTNKCKKRWNSFTGGAKSTCIDSKLNNEELLKIQKDSKRSESVSSKSSDTSEVFKSTSNSIKSEGAASMTARRINKRRLSFQNVNDCREIRHSKDSLKTTGNDAGVFHVKNHGSFYLGDKDDNEVNKATATVKVSDMKHSDFKACTAGDMNLEPPRTTAHSQSTRPSTSVTSEDILPTPPSSARDGKTTFLEQADDRALTRDDMKDSLMIILSGMYGILLVVLGLVLPIAETFADPSKPYMFELYYVYLYGVSFMFLLYVYTYLLRKQQTSIIAITRSIFNRSLSTKSASAPVSGQSQPTKKTSTEERPDSTQTIPNSVRAQNTVRSSVGKPSLLHRGYTTGSLFTNRVSPLTRCHPSNSSTGRVSAARHISSSSVGGVCEMRHHQLMRQSSFSSSMTARGRRKKIAYDPEASHHTGGFYLRMGVIAFGIGSMIHSALAFGHYFEINHSQEPCNDILQAIKPFTHLIFTFVQMYFVFMNSKMCVHKYKSLARFGLMHMSGTNICVWLRSIMVETLHVIQMEENKNNAEVTDKGHRDLGLLPELNCHKWDAMVGKIVAKSSVYLYPCTIEYSLVCACVLYIMWSNVGGVTTTHTSADDAPKPRTRQESGSEFSVDGFDDTEEDLHYAYDDDDDEDDEDDNFDKSTHRMSVDCTSSSQGLFFGILLFVVAVVLLVCFYVLIGTEKHKTGILLGHISENVIYLVSLIATLIAGFQMRKMHFSINIRAGIEEILTLISLAGLVLFGIFSIIASVFYLHTLSGVLTIVTNLCMILQAGTQATFTLVAVRASAVDGAQVRHKPGRQFVTFLLVSNFALWVINTFETQRLEHNPLQVEFYGVTAWSIFSHISVPLGIYFRFHSTVSLSNIWKKAWKMKHMKRADSFTFTTSL